MGCESRDAMGEVSNTLQAYFLSANNQAYAMRNKCVAYIMTQQEPTGLQWCLLNTGVDLSTQVCSIKSMRRKFNYLIYSDKCYSYVI